ncbi:UDP-N-acetylmuramoyl-L-alanyl-D-glutamate--2,6-diaminopimelate ligase [Dubosiella newyorkensis]|uniref:UDP-N-acetylmuramoyl-L-alanyl-D-glutamate--2, 6-diaminopimelate ligase n=1 Tax=Dubosiella newyorkensis TaxID=1862672 RepID=UPI00248AF4A6|nr:UDP-N-acetylmuramoyl-L-alanyl-D-glutamate--2,6-diaminopimelate ligase [Dubosiella newyorkensis]
MRLSKLFKNAPTVNVSGLCFDSRKVKPDNVYFCLPGLTFDGHDFIDDAIKNGAICIVHSREIEKKQNGVIYIKVSDVNAAMNQCARLYYGRPSDKMTMFGITGTNGKSTIANIIRSIMNEVEPCGYIGTIAIEYGDVKLMPDLTTPDALFLQSKLADMVNAGIKACALEVSSHGLSQGRVDGINFNVAVFTNFTYDHLDFHGTLENYFDAKCILFKDRVRSDGVSILNIDDKKFEALKSISKARVISYGIDHEADYRAINIQMDSNSTHFDLVYQGKAYSVMTNLVATYNIYNLLAAIAALHESGVSMDTILSACSHLPQVEGRLEQIKEGQSFNVIVDFAHTPDGMEKMMQFGRMITPENSDLIAVFGSAGKRDVAKRKVFGELADKYCDYVILTEDDPRDEDPKEIADMIKEGIKNTANIYIEDRYEAIRQAIENAKESDTILLLGKGDEAFIYREEGRAPWIGDDKAARECIQKYRK